MNESENYRECILLKFKNAENIYSLFKKTKTIISYKKQQQENYFICCSSDLRSSFASINIG